MSANNICPLLSRSQAAIMGIINITPDSFSDGGQFDNLDAAINHGLTLIDQGADILDIGGESTRPGAPPVSLGEELKRVLPVIEALTERAPDTPISIDTSKPDVMLAAVQAGAQMINDVNGLRADGSLEVSASLNVPVCIMHMQGSPKTMQAAPSYNYVVDDVMAFYQQRINDCNDAGIDSDKLILDPGIGFGKTLNHNLLLLQNIARMKDESGCEILIGVSRKSLIEQQLGRPVPVQQRLFASLGLAVQSMLNGAKILRVHDVRATYDAVRMAEAVRDASVA